MHDVIIAGLGAMGSAAAYHLARRGARVLGLEQFEIPHARGSSHGHSRMIRMAYYEHPDYVPLLRRAYELWHELEATSHQKLLHLTGGIYMDRPTGPVVAGALQAAQQHGLSHELLDRHQLSTRFPQFSLPGDYVGFYEPHAGFLLPEKTIATHALEALKLGADLHGCEPILDWSADTSAVTVRTPLATYRAKHLLFCGGAWTDKLVTGLGIPLRVTRQALGWVWPAHPERYGLGNFPVWGIHQPDGSLAYGFPMMPDNPGLKLARHGLGELTDPDQLSRDPRLEDRDEIDAIPSRYLPDAARRSLLALRICMYTNSPDGHFIIDRHPNHPQVSLACGFSGHGFKFASVIGELLADLALTGRTPHPIGFLSLQRFAHP